MPEILQKFDGKYLYSAWVEFPGGKPEIHREKIKVLYEQFADGASVSTYVIRHMDGSVAQVDKSMFYPTQLAADDALYDDFVQSYADNLQQRQEMDKVISEIEEAITLLRGEE